MRDVVPDRTERPMDMTRLAAGVAVIADQRGAAVEAQPGRVAMMRVTPMRLDRARDQPRGGDVADCFDAPCHGGVVPGYGPGSTPIVRNAVAISIS